MAVSVSMVRPAAGGGDLQAEVAIELDGHDFMVFRFHSTAQAAKAGNELRAAVVAAADIVIELPGRS